MAIHVALNHKTVYRYDRLVELSPQIVRLRPAPHARTPILAYSMKVTPEEHFCNWQLDPQSNYLARLVFPEKTREFRVEVDLIADMTVINPFDFFLEPFAEKFPFSYPKTLSHEIGPFLQKEPSSAGLRDFMKSIDTAPTPMNDFLVAINQRLQGEIRYVVRLEPGVQTCEQTLALRSGSCRDSSWLLVQVLRHLGLAARFVSGYLIQLTPDIKSLDGPTGTEQDFTDLHAWAEVYLPGAGWIGLDPTSGLFASEGHIPLACSPDPSSAAPITGAVDECETQFHHDMAVTRVHEDPRVTKPYTEEQWTRIDALGKEIDVVLEKNDVRLTMGGEPTFVSIDDMEGDEWNTGAMGITKRERAGVLTRRLRKRFGVGGLLHFGQGKWYPGEPLPRWALGCYWRRDGEPIWRNEKLMADDFSDYGHDASDAGRFVKDLAQRIGVDTRHCIAGYEDAFYYLWKERRLPENVDSFDSKLENAEDRARLARVFEQGLDRVVGYALPLRPSSEAKAMSRWLSGSWIFRAKRMYLTPGDSPMGLRLPLEMLPWLAPEDRPKMFDRDPLEPRGPLPAIHPSSARRANAPCTAIPAHAERASHSRWSGDGEDHRLTPETVEQADAVVRTALCVEPREGRIHVFMPPVSHLEDYLDLVAAIEDTAEAFSLPVRIEGYTPPHDCRIDYFKVTPDPGVIEVNVQPATHWDELVSNTTTLYEEARLSRLGTEKFMLDGRHTGTGGGNHIVIGGPTPADSPVLRRPDLLRSLIGFWHNHPSLSYVFSGLFVGPTSQAPRVEESRADATYELGIAFQQIPDDGAAPWIVDRVFRHLLVDIVGNTHRAEFCIDKLYSPDSATGRLGLVEFRAFEMPPHARMSLTQQLLLRALIARFWSKPYRVNLAQWGSELYDRFALPHFLAQDLGDVIEELVDAGYPLESTWFDPHVEFRFPRMGQIERRGIVLELRQAVEPWYVLGEETTGGGTARYVDSSVERVQVKVFGMTDERHVVMCNGRRVPLCPTGTNGEFVAGVRYRAWQPPSCLHPTIPVHTPLVFDIVDTWVGRSIGGCTYHVAHPGGRHYETFPVNAYEAESRRTARFFSMGHTPGFSVPEKSVKHRRFPMTLDLRT